MGQLHSRDNLRGQRQAKMEAGPFHPWHRNRILRTYQPYSAPSGGCGSKPLFQQQHDRALGLTPATRAPFYAGYHTSRCARRRGVARPVSAAASFRLRCDSIEPVPLFEWSAQMTAHNDTEAAPASLAPSALAETPDKQPIVSEKPQDARDEPAEPAGAPKSSESPETPDSGPKSAGDIAEKRPQTEETKSPQTKAQPPAPDRNDDLVAKLLEFLSTATPRALGGVAAGLSLVTYLFLGRIGLVLIGAFGGVVLFVSYEAKHPEVSRAVRGEAGNDTIQRLLQQLKDAARETDGDDQDATEDQLLRSFDDFRPKTREAMKGFVDAVIRDYVKWWYTPIVPSDRSFPLASRKLFSSFLLSISNHLARKRPADVFLDFLTNSTSMVIVFFSELSAAFAELPPDSNVTSIDAVYNYLASNPDSNLSSLLNQQTQSSKFHMIADDFLSYLEQSACNAEVVRVFSREIFANIILESTLRTCSQPEWINGWIVYLLEAGEPDFNQAIDVGMQSNRDANPGILPDLDHGAATGTMYTAQTTSPEDEDDEAQAKDTESNHKKKLSKADEEMEEAMEEMKRLNQMIAEENSKRNSKGPETEKGEERSSTDTAGRPAPAPLDDTSARPRPSSDKDPSTDGHSSKGEAIYTPVTPDSAADSGSQASSPKQQPRRRFTSFDQIVPKTSDVTDDGEEPRKPTLTLHNATVTIHDEPGSDKSRIRGRPNWDYLIQIEPGSSSFPGWMVVRKYADFETLHEILRRIANISSASAFAEQHAALPPWKAHTRESLRVELERYVRDACGYQSLAESEGMKRFLDKDQGLPQGAENRASFGFDMFGRNVMDALSTAPKGAMQGGKTVMGGVTNVLGNIGIGQKKPTSSPPKDTRPAAASRLSISTPPRVNSIPSPVPSLKGRDSMDSQRSSIVSTQPGKVAPMERRASSQFDENDDGRQSRSERFDSARGSKNPSRASSRAPSRAPARSPSTMSLDSLNLPPLPSEVKDDYDPRLGHHKRSKTTDNPAAPPPVTATSPLAMPPITSPQEKQEKPSPPKRPRQYAPLTEQEASVAVELMFAIINELYTLTSAWNIRRTLLGAAKSFLLRPGNPSLTSIRALIQESVLDANTSDAGIAFHLQKLRENSLPTEEELAGWPAEMTQEEKDKLRDKARRLLIKSGVPAALTGVMGQSATSEAVGRVFDCLQIEEVARGLMFGVMLQAVRVVTH